MVLDAISTTETHAQMTVADQRAPSSQLGGQGSNPLSSTQVTGPFRVGEGFCRPVQQ